MNTIERVTGNLAYACESVKKETYLYRNVWFVERL